MALGDSLTFGVKDVPAVGGGSYRANLWDSLTKHGIQLDFVGSQYSNNPSSNKPPDPDNEGYPGAFIYTINDGLDHTFQVLGDYGKTPHIVLLLIGTNDMRDYEQAVTARYNLPNLVNKILSKDPNLALIVAKIPLAIALYDRGLFDYYIDDIIPTTVAFHANAGRNIRMVDMYRALEFDRDFADGVHPNDYGYSKMANTWYPAVCESINQLLAQPVLPTFTPGPPLETSTPTPNVGLPGPVWLAMVLNQADDLNASATPISSPEPDVTASLTPTTEPTHTATPTSTPTPESDGGLESTPDPNQSSATPDLSNLPSSTPSPTETPALRSDDVFLAFVLNVIGTPDLSTPTETPIPTSTTSPIGTRLPATITPTRPR
jgi:lysophospholipase L1-like esterase